MKKLIALIVLVAFLGALSFATDCRREEEIANIRHSYAMGRLTYDQYYAALNMQESYILGCVNASLRANDADIDAITLKLNINAIALNDLVRKKWCRKTFWRRISGYRYPDWCAR